MRGPGVPYSSLRASFVISHAGILTMASTARGAEEEVFETPDFTEDVVDQGSPGPDSGMSKTANKVGRVVHVLGEEPACLRRNKRQAGLPL